MMNRLYKDQTICITGASMGIGRELALVFAAAGANLLLVARSKEKLEALEKELHSSGGRNQIVIADLSEESGRARVLEAVSSLGKLDILIHNPGKGLYGEVAHTSLEDFRDLFELNFFAIVDLTRKLLPLMRSPGGKIAAISSTVGHVSVPRMAAYCASKFALNGFLDALRLELVPLKIDVLNVYPGVTQTEFSKNAKQIDSRPLGPAYSSLEKGMSPQKVARKVVRALTKNKRDEWVSYKNRLAAGFRFFFPQCTDWLLKRFLK